MLLISVACDSVVRAGASRFGVIFVNPWFFVVTGMALSMNMVLGIPG